jgi:hypothetical protein
MKKLLAAVAAALTPSALADVKITDQPYVQPDPRDRGSEGGG